MYIYTGIGIVVAIGFLWIKYRLQDNHIDFVDLIALPLLIAFWPFILIFLPLFWGTNPKEWKARGQRHQELLDIL